MMPTSQTIKETFLFDSRVRVAPPPLKKKKKGEKRFTKLDT